jgi:hypothetical protein
MNPSKQTARFLGAAFLFVLVVSLIFGFLSDQTLLSGSISDSFVKVSNNLTQMRIGILFKLLACLGIVVLAVLLYVVLNNQNKTIALVALGWWLAEAITLAVGIIGAFSLIPLSLDYMQAGAPDASYFQTLGALFRGVNAWAYDIHMWFYCLGGILWFSLFYRSRYVPRVFAIWGMAAISAGLVGMVLVLFDVRVNFLLFLQIAVFELTIGLWLVVKGIPSAIASLSAKQMKS